MTEETHSDMKEKVTEYEERLEQLIVNSTAGSATKSSAPIPNCSKPDEDTRARLDVELNK